MRTWSTRPWNKDGMQLPVVNHARVDIEVEFRDFAALSRWVAAHDRRAPKDSDVSYVEWVTDTRSGDRDLLRQVRTEAVEGCRRGARSSTPTRSGSARFDRSRSPTPECSARPSQGGEHHDAGSMARAMSVGSAPPEIELIPEDIEVSATVDARFVAG